MAGELENIKESIRNSASSERTRDKVESKIGRFLKRRVLPIALPLLVAGGIAFWYFGKDFALKRQNYPERNILYRATDKVEVTGGTEARGAAQVDSSSEKEVQEGGMKVGSKVGTRLFTTKREIIEDIEYFNMYDSQNIRKASATRKPEEVQAGPRWGGSINFKEQIAELIETAEEKAPQKYRVYKFVPERGTKEKEVTIVENPDGTRTIENNMTELRTWGIGWYYGKVFRAGTSLEDYKQKQERLEDPNIIAETIRLISSREKEDVKKGEEMLNNTSFSGLIQILNNTEIKGRTEREKIINKMLEMEQNKQKDSIYSSFEDGIIDLLPQESTIYLAHKPGLGERTKHWLGFGRHDKNRLRVENHWDLWPGRIYGLDWISFGEGKNVLYPFHKYNNGGYTLKDKFGDIAKIDIKDFFLFYGSDILYKYYFDLNGDGKLDKKNELIGEVLCRTTHDERLSLKHLVGEGKPKVDVSFNIHYSFMSPTSDLEKSMKYFNLCGYVESCMPDQINRGFGKHSMLGYINEVRSDVMLFNDFNIQNMSRSLTQESTLVAKDDIINVLNAAKRPYAKKAAEHYGIADKFEGKYQTSELLKEKIELGPLPALAAIAGAGLGVRYWIKRRSRKGKLGEKL